MIKILNRGAVLLLLLSISLSVTAITADQILDQFEANNVHKTSYYKGKMRISDSLGTREKSFLGYTEGKQNMLLEFTNVEDAGQKILRLNGEIYLYFPEAEEIITLRGEALKDSIMGSDFSYEDLANEGTLRDKYTATLAGEEQVDGRACYKLILEARPDAEDIIYPREIIWIDKERYVELKAQLFSLSGKVLKDFYVSEVKKIGSKYLLTHYEMVDSMKTSSKTEFILEEIKIDLKLDPYIFSLEELSW